MATLTATSTSTTSLQLLVLLLILALCSCNPAAAFAPSTTGTASRRTACCTMVAATAKEQPVEDDIVRLQRKARQLLEKSKAKLAATAQDAQESTATTAAVVAKKKSNGAAAAVPFFATAVPSREGVIKSRNAETGLLVADGERMAALSEKEEWENRSLLEVFENEMAENEDVYSTASQQLAARDVAASIFDLRKQLQTDDYKKIFNTRNPFIGEDN